MLADTVLALGIYATVALVLAVTARILWWH